MKQKYQKAKTNFFCVIFFKGKWNIKKILIEFFFYFLKNKKTTIFFYICKVLLLLLLSYVQHFSSFCLYLPFFASIYFAPIKTKILQLNVFCCYLHVFLLRLVSNMIYSGRRIFYRGNSIKRKKIRGILLKLLTLNWWFSVNLAKISLWFLF
jgi:hypothetical protein